MNKQSHKQEEGFLVHSFKSLFLTIEKVGPFQNGPKVFDFTDKENKPCNLYLIVSENGQGKTTALELIVLLMRMLEDRDTEFIGHESLDKYQGKVQWDVLLNFSRSGKRQTVVLSLAAGVFDESGISNWDSNRLAKYGAESWHQFGLRRHPGGRLEQLEKDDLVSDLLSAIKLRYGNPPIGFEENPFHLPTLLYFPAYRNISPIREQEQRAVIRPEYWGYRPVCEFVQDGIHWTMSLDNLLVWLDWIGSGRLERAVNLVNERVFKESQKILKGVKKDPPEAIVEHHGQQHSLDKLSSGEKSLVQLFLRIGAHMTDNTLLLIDEMDTHLHLKWQFRLLNHLKKLAMDNDGITIISTTHSREIWKAFEFEITEENLRKGADVITENL